MKHKVSSLVTQMTARAGKGDSLNVVIETPKGSRNKFKFDQTSGMFKLSKVLPEGMMFPYDFGFIPSTQAEDGDPLDVLVLMDEPTFSGCLLECRLIGVIEALQEEKGEEHRNDRLIAVASQSIRYSDIHDLDDLNDTILKQVEEFFINYQRVRGIKFKILAREGRRKAARMLEEHAARKNSRTTKARPA